MEIIGSIICMSAGLVFIFVSFFGKAIHRKFLLSSVRVRGVIVDIKEVVQKSDDGVNTFYLPVVEYMTAVSKNSFRFQGEIDAKQNGLELGDSMEVLIHKSNHKIAKLEAGTKELYMVLNICLVLGLVACVLSVYLFRSTGFSFEFIRDPYFFGLFILLGIFFYLKGVPILRLYVDHGAMYEENAEEYVKN